MKVKLTLTICLWFCIINIAFGGDYQFFSQAPYPGIPTTFSGSELIGAYPYINTDLLLQEQRLKSSQYYQTYHLTPPDYFQVRMGGRIQLRAYDNLTFAQQELTDIYVYKAEVYSELLINSWLTGFMAVAYDPNTSAPGVSDPERTNNSRIFLDRGFITWGNLDRNPLYFTVGQFWAPFGVYNKPMVTPPLTSLMSKTKIRSALMGYADHGLYAQTYLYRGNTVTGTNSTDNQGGLDAGYRGRYKKIVWDVGSEYITNIADSDGMQKVTGGSCSSGAAFGGFGACAAAEKLVHSVPALDFHGKFDLGPFGLIVEWIGAQRAFDPENMSFDGHGAKPQALDAEATYHFSLLNRPSAWSIGYGETQQALALNLAAQRYVTNFSISIWKQTVEKLEFKHELNYPDGSTATGQNAASTNVGHLGQSSDTVTAEFSVFF